MKWNKGDMAFLLVACSPIIGGIIGFIIMILS